MSYNSKYTGAQVEEFLDQIENKQNEIEDLETIRSGAAKGATAIQEVKTINGQSIVGSGDITIEGGGGGDTSSIEKVTAAALNDLNKRVKALPTSTIVDNKIAKAVSEVNANHDGDIAEVNASVTDLLNEVVRNEKILAHAINDLKTQIDDLYSKINAQ